MRPATSREDQLYERVAYEDMLMHRYGLPHPDRINDLPWYFLSRIDDVIAAIGEARQRNAEQQ